MVRSSLARPVFFFFVVIQTFNSFQFSHGYPGGAPTRVCDSMTPQHNQQGSFDKAPYEMSVDQTYIKGGAKITVEVKSINPSKYTLTGLLIVMKRPGNKNQAFGKFEVSPGSGLQTINCFDKEASAVTQTDKSEKSSLKFYWIAPNDTKADYELHATYVRDFNYFWVDQVYPKKIVVDVDAPYYAPSVSSALKVGNYFSLSQFIAITAFTVWCNV